jgi:glycosyltransferase involved in cell wall biosynthesis
MWERDVLCLSSIDWEDNWQIHQQLAVTLAARGDRVLFVENTGVRSPTWGDAPRIRQRLANWARAHRELRAGDDRLTVHAPMVLPFPYSRIATALNRVLLQARVLRWRRREKGRDLVLWTFLPTPLTAALIRALRPSLTVYYCVDDLASTSPAARRITSSEIALLRTADLVLVTSEGLRARVALHRAQVALLPSAVDIEPFERIRNDPTAVPPDLRALPRPVVGYLGEVKRWVDQDLLRTAAERLPGASFVLIGPVRTDVARLTGVPNLHMLGARPHAEVPAYLLGFDVGLIPYRIAPYTNHVHPVKLLEYLAMGLPVVSTPLPEIAHLNAAHGDLVAIATDADGFCTAIQRAIDRPDSAATARRVMLARANSWTARFATMASLLEATLAAKVSARDAAEA